MPMYFPDLRSVYELAQQMRNQKDKKYLGIIPILEVDLPEARKQLAAYMREVWNDEVFAMEIELTVSEETYEEKMLSYVRSKMLGF